MDFASPVRQVLCLAKLGGTLIVVLFQGTVTMSRDKIRLPLRALFSLHFNGMELLGI